MVSMSQTKFILTSKGKVPDLPDRRMDMRGYLGSTLLVCTAQLPKFVAHPSVSLAIFFTILKPLYNYLSL